VRRARDEWRSRIGRQGLRGGNLGDRINVLDEIFKFCLLEKF